MGKLKPKNIVKRPKHSWDFLDRVLQHELNSPSSESVVINLNDYQMTKAEIISELKLAGYSVEDPEDGYLVIS